MVRRHARRPRRPPEELRRALPRHAAHQPVATADDPEGQDGRAVPDGGRASDAAFPLAPSGAGCGEIGRVLGCDARPRGISLQPFSYARISDTVARGTEGSNPSAAAGGPSEMTVDPGNRHA